MAIDTMSCLRSRGGRWAAWLLGALLATSVASAGDNRRHEVENAESRHEVLDAEPRHEVGDTDDEQRQEVEDAEARD